MKREQYIAGLFGLAIIAVCIGWIIAHVRDQRALQELRNEDVEWSYGWDGLMPRTYSKNFQILLASRRRDLTSKLYPLLLDDERMVAAHVLLVIKEGLYLDEIRQGSWMGLHYESTARGPEFALGQGPSLRKWWLARASRGEISSPQEHEAKNRTRGDFLRAFAPSW